jgi:outer membrane protein TolC
MSQVDREMTVDEQLAVNTDAYMNSIKECLLIGTEVLAARRQLNNAIDRLANAQAIYEEQYIRYRASMDQNGLILSVPDEPRASTPSYK